MNDAEFLHWVAESHLRKSSLSDTARMLELARALEKHHRGIVPLVQPIELATPYKLVLAPQKRIIACFGGWWYTAEWYEGTKRRPTEPLWYAQLCHFDMTWMRANQPKWFIPMPEISNA